MDFGDAADDFQAKPGAVEPVGLSGAAAACRVGAAVVGNRKAGPGPAVTWIVGASPEWRMALSIKLRKAFSIRARWPRNGAASRSSKAMVRPDSKTRGASASTDMLRQIHRIDFFRRGDAGAFEPRQCRQLFDQMVERLQVLLDLARARIGDLFELQPGHGERRADFMGYGRSHDSLRLHEGENALQRAIHRLGVIGDLPGHACDRQARRGRERIEFRGQVARFSRTGRKAWAIDRLVAPRTKMSSRLIGSAM